MTSKKESSAISVREMKDAILDSGYLIEQRVSEIIRNKGYYVETNSVYVDPITNKSREYDIDAIAGHKLSKEYDFIFSRIICECENNHQPIVFFINNTPISFLHTSEVKLAGIPTQILQKDSSLISIQDFIKMEKFHHYCTEEIATQYCSFKKKKDNTSWIAMHEDNQHDTLNNIVFAVDHLINNLNRDYVLPKKNKKELINIEIYYPLIVVQGELYKCYEKDNDISIESTQHLQYRKETIIDNKVEKYQIDIITEKYLPEYLNIIEKEITTIIKKMKKNKTILEHSIIHLVDEMRKASTPEERKKILEF